MTILKLPRYACLRCSHQWIPRIVTRPKRCPRCKSPYWYTPRKRGVTQHVDSPAQSAET